MYDEIENKRDQQKKEVNKESRKPKYISRLLQCAERRKIESERRLERMIQKERELEGEQFKDKETFVTSAYRKKLEELRKAEEREKHEEYLEAIGDVKKQKNLDGFYRHLYEQKLGKTDNEKKEEDDNTNNEKQSATTCNKFISSKSRVYRKRKSSEEDFVVKSQEEKEDNTKKVHLQSNIDADSDFSIDSSSDNEDIHPNTSTSLANTDTKVLESATIEKETKSEFKVPMTLNTKNESISTPRNEKTENKTEKNNLTDNQLSNSEETEEKLNKKNIWEKRTTGEVFLAALQRYYERKLAKTV